MTCNQSGNNYNQYDKSGNQPHRKIADLRKKRRQWYDQINHRLSEESLKKSNKKNLNQSELYRPATVEAVDKRGHCWRPRRPCWGSSSPLSPPTTSSSPWSLVSSSMLSSAKLHHPHLDAVSVSGDGRNGKRDSNWGLITRIFCN